MLERERTRAARSSEFTAEVLTSFVRNRLIDEVYLPLVGANLAKQLGAAGENKRTDLMGMLLLVSPPGYGKTTLMEYVASKLGLVFMKVNGPALGHEVTSLDPGRGAERHRAPGGREDQPRLRDGQQRDALPRRHPAHEPGAAPEVHLAVRRPAPHRGRVEGPDAHLRPARQEVLRRDGGQPVHRDGRALPDPGHARQPRRHLQPRRHPRRQGGRSSRSSYIENALTSNAVLAPLATREPGGRPQAHPHGAGRGRPAHGELVARLLGARRSQEIIAVLPAAVPACSRCCSR